MILSSFYHPPISSTYHFAAVSCPRLVFDDSVRFVLTTETHAISSKHANSPQKQRRHGNPVTHDVLSLGGLGSPFDCTKILNRSSDMASPHAYSYSSVHFPIIGGGEIEDHKWQTVSCGRSETQYFESTRNN